MKKHRLATITALGMGLALLTTVVLVFPLAALSVYEGDTEQQVLSETEVEENDGEDYLGPQRRGDTTEEPEKQK